MYRAFLKSLFGALTLSTCTVVSASLVVSEALPNTLDDTNLESITITNTWCAEVFLTGYTLSDLVKTYTISSGSILPWQSRIFLRPETKIALNNDVETITLKDTSWSILSTLSWTTTTKGVVILQAFSLENCAPIVMNTGSTATGTMETNTGITSTGGTETSSGWTEISWSGSWAGTGETLTGATETSTWTEVSLTWTLTETGSTESSWSLLTGAVSLPVLNCAPSVGSITPGITSTVFMGFFSPCGDLTVTLTGSGEVFSWAVSAWWITFSELTEDSEYQYRISSLTGSFSDFTIGTFTTNASELSPLTLSYRDSDTNGKIDTITLTYPRSITGVLDLSKVFVYSQSGWLASRKIDSETDIISGYGFSGHDLLLTLHEQDLEKSLLHITSSTSSDLRLKSLSGWWLMDLKWREANLLTLTTMLDGYRASRIIHPMVTSFLPDSPPSAPSGLTGMTVILALQSPTNAMYDEPNRTFTCGGDLEACRINPTFEESFTGAFMKSLVRFEYSTGGEFLAHADGNPSTLHFPRGTGSLMVRFIEKSSSGILAEQAYSVTYHAPIISVGGGGSSSFTTSAATSKYPIWAVSAQIRLQSFTPSRYRYVDYVDGVETLHCVGREYCRVNLTAQDSTVPAGRTRSVLWTLPDGKPDFRDNLTEFVYSAGVYDFQIVVSDGGSFDRKYFRVIVRPHDPPRVETRVHAESKDGPTESASWVLIRPAVRISRLMPNPYGKDDQEWLEIEALESGSLSDCTLISGSKKHRLTAQVERGDTLKLSWDEATISLGNKRGTVSIICDGQTLDSVSWSGAVRDNVLLTFSQQTREALYSEYTEPLYRRHKGAPSSKKAQALPYVSLEENPVSFSLQSSGTKNISVRGGRVTCSTRADTCKVNLSATGPENVVYLWSVDGGEWTEKKDPRAFSLSHGNHTIILRAFAPTSGEVADEHISVRVIRPKSKAKDAVKSRGKTAIAAMKKETSLASIQTTPIVIPEEPRLSEETEWILFTLTALAWVIGGAYAVFGLRRD